jgi:hypothetical protein
MNCSFVIERWVSGQRTASGIAPFRARRQLQSHVAGSILTPVRCDPTKSAEVLHSLLLRISSCARAARCCIPRRAQDGIVPSDPCTIAAYSAIQIISDYPIALRLRQPFDRLQLKLERLPTRLLAASEKVHRLTRATVVPRRATQEGAAPSRPGDWRDPGSSIGRAPCRLRALPRHRREWRQALLRGRRMRLRPDAQYGVGAAPPPSLVTAKRHCDCLHPMTR